MTSLRMWNPEEIPTTSFYMLCRKEVNTESHTMKLLNCWLYLGKNVLPCFILLATLVVNAKGANDRPIIGILAQETGHALKKYGDSYFYSSYAKFVELAGAQAVPVRIDEADGYYESLFQHINGIVFPGGGVSLSTSGYAKAAKKIYDLATDANDNQDYFPLLGICLGFELLTALTNGDNLLSSCDGNDYAVPLVKTNAFEESRMYGDMPSHLKDIATQWNVTYNHHNCCVTPEKFRNSSLLVEFYKITTENRARDGVEFVSSFEGKKYPFYGVQWHPEKNIFQWDHTSHINHSQGAVQVTQYIANFFVSEARKSPHSFPSKEAEASSLIDNYQAVYMGLPSLKDIYFFNLSQEGDYDATGFDWIGFHVSERCKRGLKIMLMMFVIIIVMVTLGIFLRRWLQLNNQAMGYQHLLSLSERFAMLDHGRDTPKTAAKPSQCTYDNAPEKISIAVPD